MIIDRVLTRRLGPAVTTSSTSVPIFDINARSTAPQNINLLPAPPRVPASPTVAAHGPSTTSIPTIPCLLDLQLGRPRPEALAAWNRIREAWPQPNRTTSYYQQTPDYNANFPPLPPQAHPEAWQTVHHRDRRPRTTPLVIGHTGPIRQPAAKLLATTVRIQQQYLHWKRQLPPSLNHRLSQLFQDIKPPGRPSSRFNDERDEGLDITRGIMSQIVRDELERSYRHNIDLLQHESTPDRSLIEHEALELLHGSTIQHDVIDAVFQEARSPPPASGSPRPSTSSRAAGSSTDRHARPNMDDSSSDEDSDNGEDMGMDTVEPTLPSILPPLPPRAPKTPKRKRSSPPAVQASITKRRLNSPPLPSTPASRQLFPLTNATVDPSTAASDIEPSDTETTPPSAHAPLPNVPSHTVPSLPIAPDHSPLSNASLTPPTRAKTTTVTDHSQPATPRSTQAAAPLEPAIQLSPARLPTRTPPSTTPPAAIPPSDTATAESDLIGAVTVASTSTPAPQTATTDSTTTPLNQPSSNVRSASSTPLSRSFRFNDEQFRPPARIFILGDSNLRHWPINDPRVQPIIVPDLNLHNVIRMTQRIRMKRPDLSALLVTVGLADAGALPAAANAELAAIIRQLSLMDQRFTFTALPEFERASTAEGATIMLINKLARASFSDRFIRLNPSMASDLDDAAQPHLAYGPVTGALVFKSVATFLNNCSFFHPLSPPLVT